jgi:hypothetical protein
MVEVCKSKDESQKAMLEIQATQSNVIDVLILQKINYKGYTKEI